MVRWPRLDNNYIWNNNSILKFNRYNFRQKIAFKNKIQLILGTNL